MRLEPTATDYVPGCVFCAVAHRMEAVDEVCRGNDWVAFFPDTPATPGHTLIIPHRHVTDLWKADETLAARLMEAVVIVGRAITTAVEPDGMNLISSAGSVAEQSVFHLHLHVVPRWRNDPIDEIWPPKRRMEEPLRDELAARIRDLCRGD